MKPVLHSRRRFRKNFYRSSNIPEIPCFIELQKSSWDRFTSKLEDNCTEGHPIGNLHSAFLSIFPVESSSGRIRLEYHNYKLDKPRYGVDECRRRGLTYESPLKASFTLIFLKDEEVSSNSVRTEEQEVYLGDLPVMTPSGTFIVNGVERVVVSQVHRSPGIFFDHDKGKTHASERLIFSSRVVPYRGSWGSWLEFEFDLKDILYVRIDRRRKLPATTLLMAMIGFQGVVFETRTSQSSFESECQLIKKKEFSEKKDAKKDIREEILNMFYSKSTFIRELNGWKIQFDLMCWCLGKTSFEVLEAKSGRSIISSGEKITDLIRNKIKYNNVGEILISDEELLGRYSAVNVFDEKSDEILLRAGEEITSTTLKIFKEKNIKEIILLNIDYINVGSYLRDTLAIDKNSFSHEAITDICRILRPGEPITHESSRILFRSLFFDQNRYDLSLVGRVRMNARLGINVDSKIRVLCLEDIVAIIRTLLDLRDGRGKTDDIDSLTNRRVRSVGELLGNQFILGLTKVARIVKERMSSLQTETFTPRDLINAKIIFSVIREFFTSSQLSQFLDQVNPLTEVAHKRRLSSLGPGGLSRDRAGFEVRDIHASHYGRICPIETPEGPNIGLINYLATHARVNLYGFIETPYRSVYDGVVTDQVKYLSSGEEDQYTVAPSNAKIDEKNRLVDQFVSCRRGGEFTKVSVKEIQLMDISPQQLFSVAASLVPFLENDDANRALMGANMQRQAVPLMQAESPLVGTGIERQVALDSRVMVVARRGGIVNQVDASRIVIRSTNQVDSDSSIVDIYNLHKFQRSNQNTCINHRPLVKPGDRILQGEILADGPGTESGELALGRNVFVAFMSWNGFNYEDSIILSDRLVREDVFTSIHIEEFEAVARDTKLGPEEITRDTPNVSEESLRYLDEAGIISIGSEVKPGDILVGKITPKGESPLTPEGRLLRSIFGEKASDIRDTSLRVPPGVTGTVVEVRIFNRRGIEKDERSLSIERFDIKRLESDYEDEKNILDKAFYDQFKDLLLGQKLETYRSIDNESEYVKDHLLLDEASLSDLSKDQLSRVVVKDSEIMKKIETLQFKHNEDVASLARRFENRIKRLESGDDLATGVLKIVKVFVASKRKIQVGDKMSGRHGNKGVVSIIVPEEDMPHLEDGTPIDVILNPLGVPSRMNVGQIFETHLGWSLAKQGEKIESTLNSISKGDLSIDDLRQLLVSLYHHSDEKSKVINLTDNQLLELGYSMIRGIPVASPVFESLKEKDIVAELEHAGLPRSGQIKLIDGRTGEPFDRPVTVGYIYLMKLNHMVDDKIHARSVGPYSLVTQQPLGGKAQFGGQRLGEMEVWALEAYGASHTLQEMLTVKSDDVSGRVRVYESVIRGDSSFETGIPESFNVLVKELRSLGMNIEFGSLKSNQEYSKKEEIKN